MLSEIPSDFIDKFVQDGAPLASNSSLFRILLIDADPTIAVSVRHALGDPSHEMRREPTGRGGIDWVKSADPDLILVDEFLPDMTGLEVVREIRGLHCNSPVVLLGSQGYCDRATEATKSGANEHLHKPIEAIRLRRLVHEAIEIKHSMQSPIRRGLGPGWSDLPLELVSQCPVMQQTFASMGRVATKNVSVLIRGEIGTGKRAIARHIHAHSNNRDQEIHEVFVNSMNERQLELELFGDGQRQPIFERFPNATIILHEVASLPLDLQSRLYHYLNLKHSRLQYERNARGRFVATSSDELEHLVRDGEMRSDLYYWLSSSEIRVPALRQRQGDIPLLIEHALERLAREVMGSDAPMEITQEAMRQLTRHTWPGNFDEFKSVMRQAVVTCCTNVISTDCLSITPDGDAVVAGRGETSGSFQTQWDDFADRRIDAGAEDLYEQAILETDRKLLCRVLQHTSGNQALASRILGITRTSLRKKLKQVGLIAQQLKESATG